MDSARSLCGCPCRRRARISQQGTAPGQRAIGLGHVSFKENEVEITVPRHAVGETTAPRFSCMSQDKKRHAPSKRSKCLHTVYCCTSNTLFPYRFNGPTLIVRMQLVMITRTLTCPVRCARLSSGIFLAVFVRRFHVVKKRQSPGKNFVLARRSW